MSNALPPYAELHCRSNFSFLQGASHPEELVATAQARGYSALALTDEASLAGVVRAHVEAKSRGLPLVVGAELRLGLPPAAAGAPGAPEALDVPAVPPTVVVLAQSRAGYAHLSQWVSTARRRAPKGQYQAWTSDLQGQAPGLPAGLPGCFALLLPQPGHGAAVLQAQARWLADCLGPGRAAIAVALLHRPHEAERARWLPEVAAATGLPLVAAGDVRMHARHRKPLLDVLTATRLNRPVADCGFALQPNAEAHLRSRQRLQALYPPEWLAESLRIAEACSGFSLDQLRYEYPQEIVPAGHTPASWLRALTEAGAQRRYPQGVPAKVRATLEHELQVIAQLRYEPYFLTVADIVQWARAPGREILCQGRGSAANSVVCYCLGVTEVNPAEREVLFERFISVERNEPPDIDIDFEHQRREEVIQYLYTKYGRHRAALTAVVIRYQPRSALRDVGRALGLDGGLIAAVAKAQQWWDGRAAQPERLREHGLDPEALVCRQWMALTAELVGFPRHLSQHPGGFLIARDDIAQLVPIENAAMAGRTVVQWDKDDLDALRLLKVDILALGMLSAIRRALQLLAVKLGQPGFGMQQVPREDPAVYAMLCRADSIGVFQVESRAQMSMLPRLKPETFYDLVVEVAIVRPGPIQGGMVHPYLQRRQQLEPVTYPKEEVKAALARTQGIPIFQEQVMQLAMIAAEFTPGEADHLRRSMAAWRRKGGLGPFHERLVGRMVARGYSQAYAESIFRQIEGFGEYGFPESHAASFALLVYISAWIKCHHPEVFLAALLNSQPMGFYAPAQLVRDARAHGVQVLPVDLWHSAWDSTLGDGGASPQPTVRLGFSRLSGFREADAQRIVAARADGPFASVEDLARRAGLDALALQCLADGDALRALAGHRRQAAWAVRGVDTRATALLAATRSPEPVAALPAAALGDEVLADYRSSGLSLKQHPLALLRPRLDAFQVLPASALQHCRPGQLVRASGLVTHRQRPGTAKGVVFVTLEDDTGAVNVIVWPQVVEAQRRPLLAARLLTVYGVWQAQGEVRHLIARRLVDHSELLNGLVSRSRDFH